MPSASFQIKSRQVGCCSKATLFAAVQTHCQFAIAPVASCLGACFAVWVPSVGHAQPARAAANHTHLGLYNYNLRTIRDLLPSTPCKMLLAELSLLLLQVFWWQQTLQFWNSLAALPAGSFSHTVCLDNLTDAFCGVACSMALSLEGCLHSVGYDMQRVCDVIPMLELFW